MGKGLTLGGIGLAVLMVAGFSGMAGAFVSPASAQAATAHTASVNCSDFSSQAAAQNYFNGHNPSADPQGLDADHDGKACESNPCPCSSGGGGGGGKGGSGQKPKGGHHHHHKKHKKHRKKPLEQAPRAGLPVYVPMRCTDAWIAPPSLVLDCSEGLSSLEAITWTTFDQNGGLGSGTLRYPTNCVATCVFNEAPATFSVYRARFCRNVGRNSFTRIYTNAPDAIDPGFRGFELQFPCNLLRI